MIDAAQTDSDARRRRNGHVPQPARQHDRHAPRAGASGGADRLEALRRSVRRPLRREGAPGSADAVDGRPASSQTRARRLGRPGLRAMDRERVFPVLLRRDLFPDQAAARSHVDVGLARAHRRGKARTPARGNVGGGHAGQSGRQISDAARHRRHDGADQSGRAPHGQPSAAARDRMAEQTGQEARHRFAPVLSCGWRGAPDARSAG